MKKPLLILLIAINSLGMMWFTFYLMQLPWLASDEKFLIWSTSAIKLSNRDVPDPADFALINTSYDLQLIERFDEFGFPVGNQAITDREKLATLLEIVEDAPLFTIMDIHFVDPAPTDSVLHKQLLNVDNVIVSAHLNEAGDLEKPIFDGVDYGLSDYIIGSAFDGIYKYQLIFHDTLKLTPLKVHEKLSGLSVEKFGPFVKIGDQWTLNNFTMNYRVLQKDILNMDAGFNPVSLGELLFLSEEDIRSFVEGKIVVIGDFFEQDMHETIFEISAGPLILLNAYLTLSNLDTQVNLIFLLLMLIVYAYLSYMVFHEGDYIEKKINKFTSQRVSRYFIGFSSYIIILILFSTASFFLFNIHINIFFIAIVFYLLDRIVHWVYRLS